MFRVLGRGIAYIAIAWFSVASALAQDLPEAPLNVHPHVGMQAHWYDYDCCNMTDCAAVQMSIVNDHYVWRSWRYPEFTLAVPITGMQGVKIRPSKDGRFHACELLDQEFHNGKVGKVTGVRPLCIYVPPAM